MKKIDYDKLMIEALEKYKSEQLDCIPCENEIHCEFSKKFTAKMNKLINKQNKKSSILFHSQLQKTASIIIAVLLSLTISLNVDAIKASDFKPIYKTYDTYTEISFKSETKKEIETYHIPPHTPEDFKETADTIIDEKQLNLNYESYDGKYIHFSQKTETLMRLNFENSNIRKLTINNIQILYCKSQEMLECIWSEDDYFFSLSYPAEFGDDYMYDVIGNLKEATF